MAKRRMIDEETGEIHEVEVPDTEAVKAYKAQAKEQKEATKESTASSNEDKNPHFIQLTKGIAPAVLTKVSKANPSSIPVLMFFFENMDNSNVILVSQQTIADAIEMNVRSVTRAIKTLEEHGAIGIGKVGNANVYIVNPHVVFQQAYAKRKMVVIKGNILLGRDENKKLFEKFGHVLYNSKDNNLKVSNVNAKLVKTKEPSAPKQAPNRYITTAPEMDEYEESSTIPEDVPPWEQEEA